MRIFNHKTVVGLFGSDEEVEQAVAQLQESGFGEEGDDSLQIIDEHRLGQETPIEAPGRKVVAQPDPRGVSAGPGVVFDPVNEAGTEASAIERSTRSLLNKKGLGDEEASFYARQVGRGNSLVIVETTKERSSEAAEIMTQAGARTLES